MAARRIAELARRARGGVRFEVMSHLGIVMALSMGVLAAAAYRHHELTLRELLGRALLAESQAPGRLSGRLESEAEWWLVTTGGAPTPIGAVREPPDARVIAIARAAEQRGATLLDLGAVWQPILFATPSAAQGGVLVARMPASLSLATRSRPLAVLGALALANVFVFGALGFFVLRQRIVAPLEQLAAAARQLGEEGRAGPVAVEGPRETVAVAAAFNEMSESLARRSKQLEDAVVELRAANDDLRRTRAGLDRAERLASVGRLAAGVAHEVGNPLGAILALAEVAARDPGLSPVGREQLARVQREGERVRAILGQLLDLARPLRARSEPLDLARVADETRALVAAQRRYNRVAFSLAAEPDLPLARGDASVAAQVLLNLLLNGAEAVQGVDEPRIGLTLRSAALLRRREDADAGPRERARRDAVECVVADNGCGIAEEDRERVFDPFYTSRPPGEGTGLGLPNALRMAEEQGGTVELCEPPPGFVTAFLFRLPAAARPASAEVREASRQLGDAG